MTVTSEDGIFHAFRQIEILSREVAFEQMSKAGNAVRESMRSALVGNTTFVVTRVGKNGPFLQRTSGRNLGMRESTTQDNLVSSTPQMSQFITSFLMEKSGTLVVGGANPGFTPLLRRNGEVVGTGRYQSAVSPTTIAILHRMDTGEMNSQYPRHSKLTDDFTPRHFMTIGMATASGKVKAYLAGGFLRVMREAHRVHPVEVITRRIA